ncbi:MAG: ThuA domain-containing protein [Verrucomicrobiota bacterium]
MKINLSRFLLALLAFITGLPLAAGDAKPLKVLWMTGGGFHDYKGLTPSLTQSIQKYANVTFEVEWDYKKLAKPGYADGYDVVVYFFSQHDKDGKPIVDNIAATIRAGKPAVFIHGTTHSFRALERDAYCESIGMTSTRHDKAGPIATKKAEDHPISRFWPANWKTEKDELYENVKFWPNAKPLMTAYSDTSKKDQVVTWVNQYGKARVFGTTLGHGPPTTDMPVYHQLLANGLLWVCNQLDDAGQPKPGFGGTGAAK